MLVGTVTITHLACEAALIQICFNRDLEYTPLYNRNS